MIPKEIALQLVQLKEKSKTYSAVQRSYKIDEIRIDVAKINDEIGGLARNVDNILVDGWITKFDIENWFEVLKDKSDFPQPNPRLVYEEKQREIERQRKIAKEWEKQKLDEIQRSKDEEQIELERRKRIDEENAIKEAEEHQKRLQAQQIDEFRKICLNKQTEDLAKLQKLIDEGLDVNRISDFDGLTKIVFWNKSLNFIKLLIDSGLHVTEKNVGELYSKYKFRYNEAKLLDLLISAKNIDPSAIKIVKEIVADQKKEELELQQVQVLKEQTQRIQEFRKMCYDSFFEDINKLNELIEEGLDINNINDFDCLQTCISWGRSLAFIKFLVDSGILVKNTHIDYCYANSKHIKNSASIISILENAINIENDAVKNILKRKRNNVIGSISVSCIFLFSLFLPQILNREMDSGYYVFIGIITILFLIMTISFIVDLRKEPKITNTIHLHGNQLPHPRQAGYERPNAQGKIGIAGSLKEFNPKEIRRKKMILWIVVILISISTIALIYIYFEEVIAFLKVALIIVVIIALFIWRYSPTKRR